MKPITGHTLGKLIYCLIWAFLGIGVSTVICLYLAVPLVLFVIHGTSFSLPNSETIHKAELLVVFGTFVVGTITWISNEVQQHKRESKGPSIESDSE